MATTFTALAAEIKSYIERDDLDAVIPSFINLAEQRIVRDTKSLVIENVVTDSFTNTVAVYAKPTNWVRTLSFNYGSGTGNNEATQLILHDYEYIKQYWPNRTLTLATKPPKFYADYDFNHFIIAPTPNANYPFELIYLQQPQYLTQQNQTNIISINASDLLFYASMINAMRYLMRDERIPVWEQPYMQALAAFNGQDDMRVTDRASNRSSD